MLKDAILCGYDTVGREVVSYTRGSGFKSSHQQVYRKNVRIVLSEMMPENYAIAGELVQDQKDPFGKSAK